METNYKNKSMRTYTNHIHGISVEASSTNEAVNKIEKEIKKRNKHLKKKEEEAKEEVTVTE